MDVQSTDNEEEPPLGSLIILLGNMSDRLAIHKQRLGSLTVENDPSYQTLFTAPAAHSTSRTRAEREVTTDPQLAVQDNVPDVSEDV